MAAEAIQRTQSEIYLEKYVIQLTSKQKKKKSTSKTGWNGEYEKFSLIK